MGLSKLCLFPRPTTRACWAWRRIWVSCRRPSSSIADSGRKMSRCQDSEMLTCTYTTKKCVPRKGKPEIRDRGAATITGYIIGGAPAKRTCSVPLKIINSRRRQQSLEPRAGPLTMFGVMTPSLPPPLCLWPCIFCFILKQCQAYRNVSSIMQITLFSYWIVW